MKCSGKIQKVFLENVPDGVAGYSNSGKICCFFKVQITELPQETASGQIDFEDKEVEIIFKD